jgi:hypothetical protein
MHHDDSEMTDKTNGLPSFLGRGLIQARYRKRIIEYQLRRLKAKTMLAFVGAVFVRIPLPMHDACPAVATVM